MMNTAELNEAPRAVGEDSEGATLIDDLRRWTTDYFGYPTRQANLESWGRMSADQLQVLHANWKKLMMRPRLVRGGAL
jgi:hypothetical protein